MKFDQSRLSGQSYERGRAHTRWFIIEMAYEFATENIKIITLTFADYLLSINRLYNEIYGVMF